VATRIWRLASSDFGLLFFAVTLCFCGHLGSARSHFLQERVAIALAADGGERAVAGDDDGRVVERQHLLVNGPDNLRVIAAGQVRPPNAAAEQGVARD